MIMELKKTIVKASFDSLVEQLNDALVKADFVLCGVTDFQREYLDTMNIRYFKYKVISVDLPHISWRMVALSSASGMVLPCSISIIELYPGEIMIVPANPTEIIAKVNKNAPLQQLARQVSDMLERVIQTFQCNTQTTPDLITSWD